MPIWRSSLLGQLSGPERFALPSRITADRTVDFAYPLVSHAVVLEGLHVRLATALAAVVTSMAPCPDAEMHVPRRRRWDLMRGRWAPR